MPREYTAPLSPDFITDGPKLRKFVSLCCKTEDGKPLLLDEWQAWFIDHALERYPDDWPVVELRGRLRFREVVLSVARQNGKSEIATVLGFYGLLMHEAAPYVIGLASNKEQADLIFKRVHYSASHHPSLNKRFKVTATRGITRTDRSGYYTTKPAKADALQGIPVTLCLFDEVHLCSPDMWSAMTLGTQAKEDGLVVGLTTAGDNTSNLLTNLYEQGKQSAAGTGSERLGFFLWTAADGARIDDPEAVLDANPSIVCGRRSLDTVLDAVKRMPEQDARRYVLNQFVSSESTWLPMHLWHAAASPQRAVEGPITFTVDRTPSWEYACITATTKTADGYHSQVVWSGRKPNVEWLTDVCVRLNKHRPIRFVMDGYTLSDLARELEKRGLPVKVMRQGDVANACQTAYALIASGKVTHNDDDLLRMQMPFAVRKNVGEGWRINRQSSSTSIDAVMATVMGIYWASRDEGIVLPFAAVG
jgi:phage terminase large subunit-like protein